MDCHHFGVCGGCSLPGVPYREQLAGKQAQLHAWFPGVTLAPLVASPIESGFRHKVAFVFAPRTSGDRLVMGHYQAGSRRVVPVQECPVHSDLGNRLAFALRFRAPDRTLTSDEANAARDAAVAVAEQRHGARLRA